MKSARFSSIPVFAASLALTLAASVSLRAQTVSGFTNVSGWSGMKVDSTTYLADRYDTEPGAPSNGSDPTKQNSLNGSNSVWDMVGDQSTHLFRVASGTTSSGAAYAFSIRLGDYTSQGLKQGSVGLIMQDSAGYFGYGMSFAANGAVTTYRLTPVTPVVLTPSGFSYTFSTIASGASSILYNYETATTGTTMSGSTDAWLTFVISQTDIRSFRNDSGWTYNGNVGALAFTSSNAINGNINSDYPGSSVGALTFSSETGTIIPEFPTGLLVVGLFGPLAAFHFWRRRRAAAAAR